MDSARKSHSHGFTKKFSIKKLERRNFLVSIDGSDTSEYSFDLVSENFLSPLDSLIAMYIYNSQKDSKFNYKNKREIIEPKYKDKIGYIKNSNVNFIEEDRTSSIHPLEQTYAMALNKNINYLVCGFTGMKGPKGDEKELTKGIDFLLKNCRIPFILIKDKTVRKERKDGKYRWLCIVDNKLSNAHTAIEKFLPLIETEKDEVDFMSFLEYEGQKEYSEEIILQDVQDNHIKNYTYEKVIITDESMATLVNKKVNFEQNPYDFIIMLNNITNYSKELANNNDYSIILKSKCNICVLNQ